MKMKSPRAYPWSFLDEWTPEQWREFAPVLVATEDIVPTQEGISIKALARLVNVGEVLGGDIPHGVRYNGQTLLIDGHHRWVITILRKEPFFLVRLAELSD